MQSSFKPSVLKNLEEEIRHIHLISSESHSIKLKLLNYIPLVEKLIEIPNKNIKEAYISELINDFNHTLQNCSFDGLPPEIINRIKSVSQKLYELPFLHHTCPLFINSLNKITDWSEKLDRILNGYNIIETEKNIFIPLLENTAEQQKIVVGLLETLTIKISKIKSENKFLVVPSEKELEELIDEQIKISWNVAINYCEKFIKKISGNHEVIVHFNKRIGLCRGNSLGVVLTIKFIEELLKLYNPAFIIQAKSGLAITGGLNQNGLVLPVGDEITKLKTELVFYSMADQFVIPKHNEIAAREKLEELKTKFPERNLKIVSIEDFDDLMNRRNIISIRKINPIVRSAKFVKQNIFVALTIVVLTALFTAIFTLDFDDNPDFSSFDGRYLHIKNEKGRILWSIVFPVDNTLAQSEKFKQSKLLITDVNNDNVNEVIYTLPYTVNRNENSIGSLVCLDNKNNLLWNYDFADTAYADKEDLPPDYSLNLGDTITFEGKKLLFCFANSKKSFNSAVFALDLRSGKRLPQIFWASGHTNSILLRDIDRDSIPEILGLGLDNGYEDAVLWATKINNFDGYRLTVDEYKIKNKKPAELIFYIRIPKTDYDVYNKLRTPSIDLEGLHYDLESRSVHFNFTSIKYLSPNANNNFLMIGFELDSTYKNFFINIISGFRVIRDSLVAHGELKPPFTDTKEYREIIKNSILYLKDGKWVKRNELD